VLRLSKDTWYYSQKRRKYEDKYHFIKKLPFEIAAELRDRGIHLQDAGSKINLVRLLERIADFEALEEVIRYVLSIIIEFGGIQRLETSRRSNI